MGIHFRRGSGFVFKSIAHQVHSHTATSLDLEQVYEALAAYLGYSSYAAFRTSAEEVADFEGVVHFVPDLGLLRLRLKDLGHPEAGSKVGYMSQALTRAFKYALPMVTIYADATDLRDDAMGAIEAAIVHSGQYSSEQAELNAYGGEFDLELEAGEALEVASDLWVIDVSGTSQLDLDPDRAYLGHVLDVTARAVFLKVGRRMLGEMEIQDIRVSVKAEGVED